MKFLIAWYVGCLFVERRQQMIAAMDFLLKQVNKDENFASNE